MNDSVGAAAYVLQGRLRLRRDKAEEEGEQEQQQQEEVEEDPLEEEKEEDPLEEQLEEEEEERHGRPWEAQPGSCDSGSDSETVRDRRSRLGPVIRVSDGPLGVFTSISGPH